MADCTIKESFRCDTSYYMVYIIYITYCYFEVNVLLLRWCPFAHLFDTPFQNSPYSHACFGK